MEYMWFIYGLSCHCQYYIHMLLPYERHKYLHPTFIWQAYGIIMFFIWLGHITVILQNSMVSIYFALAYHMVDMLDNQLRLIWYAYREDTLKINIVSI